MHSSLNLIKEPFALLLIATIILLFALALRPISQLDLQGMVMFGIPMESMIWTIPLFLICLWLTYSVTRRYCSRTATWIHVTTTVVSILAIVSIVYAGIRSVAYLAIWHELVGNVIQILTLLFVAGQLFYIGTVGLGMIKRRKPQ